MKKIFTTSTFFLLTLLLSAAITPPTPSYSGGLGTETSPYLISTTDDLIKLSKTSVDWGAYFKQTADIAFNADEKQVDWDNSGSVDWWGQTSEDNLGFSPIGNSETDFTGTYDGEGHTIKNLYINRRLNGVGLFGNVSGATIENLGVTDCNVNGPSNVGGLVGSMITSSVTISNCFSTGNVSGSGYGIGGLVGYIDVMPSNISNCYSTCNASGNDEVGGLVGHSLATIEKSYSTGSVSASTTEVGGLIGRMSNGTLSDSFWNTDSTATGIGKIPVGTTPGATGKTTDEMKQQSTFTNWDFDIDGVKAGNNGDWIMAGYPHLQMEWSDTVSNLVELQMVVLNLDTSYIQTADIDASETNTWNPISNPFPPFDIIILGFSPIGYHNSITDYKYFTGSYNGQNHTISNLYIKRYANVGLFGVTNGATIENLRVIDCDYSAGGPGSMPGVYDGLSTNSEGFGGLVGRNQNSTINNCYSSGNIEGPDDSVGGLVGYNLGSTINNSCSYCTVSKTAPGNIGGLVGANVSSSEIINSYSTGNIDVNNEYTIGGLVGYNDNSTIENTYSCGEIVITSSVPGSVAEAVGGSEKSASISSPGTTTPIGGLVGENNGGTVSNSFWDITIESTDNGIGTGKTTTDLKDVATFTSTATAGLTTAWDFVGTPNNDDGTDDYWAMDQAGTINDGYPILSWQQSGEVEDNTPPVIQCNAQRIYLDEDGTYILSTQEIRAFAQGTTDNVDDFDDLEITVSRRGFNCSQVGENLDAKVIVTDRAGNQSSCWADITVYPPAAYKIDTVADVEVVAEAGECGTLITYPDFINDKCASLTQIAGVGPDSIFPVGTTTESWKMDNATEGIDTITFDVIVTATNAVPTLDSVADVDANEDAAISIELSGISTGNDCEEQQATVTAESSNADLIDSLNVDYIEGDTTATLAATLIPDASGTAEITVTVEDEMGATVSKTFTITVSAVNDAPYLITPIPDQTINASYILKVPVSPVAGDVFGDIDNDNLTLNITEEGTGTLPGWATFTNDTLLCQPMIADTGCVNIVVTASDGELTAADTFQICVAGYPTAINDLGAGKFEVNLYPNPTRGMVNVDIQSAAISDIELTVLDITGKQIVRKNYRAAERITFDMSNRVSGMYFVKLDFEGKQVLKKLIVRSLP